jgi:hypothetical protein
MAMGMMSPPEVERNAIRAEREFFFDNLLVRIHFIVEMTRHGGLNSLFQVA